MQRGLSPRAVSRQRRGGVHRGRPRGGAAVVRAPGRPAGNGGGGGRDLRGRRGPAGGGRHRHRQDPRLPGAGDPQRPPGARLHRHQAAPGPDLRQGPPRPPHRAGGEVHRRLHEGPGELPLPPPVRGLSERRPPRPRPGPGPRGHHRGVGGPDRDRGPLGDRGPAGRPPLLERDLRHVGQLHRRRLPAARGSASSPACGSGRPSRTSSS